MPGAGAPGSQSFFPNAATGTNDTNTLLAQLNNPTVIAALNAIGGGTTTPAPIAAPAMPTQPGVAGNPLNAGQAKGYYQGLSNILSSGNSMPVFPQSINPWLRGGRGAS